MKKEIEYGILKQVQAERVCKAVHADVIDMILRDLETHIDYLCNFKYDDNGDVSEVIPPVDAGTGFDYEHMQYLKYKEMLRMYEVISEL